MRNHAHVHTAILPGARPVRGQDAPTHSPAGRPRRPGRARAGPLGHAVPVAFDPGALPGTVRSFLADRHLATLTTLRADGSPHVVPVGFTWDDEAGVVRVITGGGSVKARNAARGGRAVVCQVDGRRWLALEGEARVRTAPDEVREAEERYAQRYRRPRENPERVVIVLAVDRVLGWVPADDASS